MHLSTAEEVRSAIQREFDQIHEDDSALPESEIENMVNVVMQTPAELREEYIADFVRETLDRRRGDPRT